MLTEAHTMARQRFEADPTKCYQRHIREVWTGLDGRQSPCNDECRKSCPHFPKAEREVRKITIDEAAELILKYEWLAADSKTRSPLGRGIETRYGLFLRGELIGANCFGTMGGKVGDICGPAYVGKTGYLMRGVCVHYAPMHAASFFTSMSCKLASREKGWKIFFAYSDTQAASEVGTLYQACNWYYLGEDLGRSVGSHHSNFVSPDGKQRVTSYQLNHDKERRFLRSLGWNESVRRPMRAWLRDTAGWHEEKEYGKKKWVSFEGTAEEKAAMKTACRYRLDLPYPKNRVPERKTWIM
jgi:hypothetical protein